VTVKLTLFVKLLATNTAHVTQIFFRNVSSHVAPSCARVSKAQVAVLAFVRLVTTVRVHVRLEIVVGSECFVAHSTRNGLVVVVSLPVFTQCLVRVQLFLTHTALVHGLLSCVRLRVIFQFSTSGKCKSAQLTIKFRLDLVSKFTDRSIVFLLANQAVRVWSDVVMGLEMSAETGGEHELGGTHLTLVVLLARVDLLVMLQVARATETLPTILATKWSVFAVSLQVFLQIELSRKCLLTFVTFMRELDVLLEVGVESRSGLELLLAPSTFKHPILVLQRCHHQVHIHFNTSLKVVVAVVL